MSERHTSRKPLKASEPEMRPEYDFSAAVRGKYYRRYMDSSNVVVLPPNVHEKFKNGSAVNEALRTLIRAAGRKRGPAKSTWTRTKAAHARGR
ncbi:MAG: hypothetical protein AB1452_03125 [Pseudomonadota bacterium]